MMSRLTRTIILSACAAIAVVPATAMAARKITSINADVSSTPYTFDFQGSTFTFGFNGDYFGGGPITISTATGGAVNTIFGQPTTNFADGRGGPLSFGPNDNYGAFTDPTPIRFTNGDNFIGLRATSGTDNFYGYAFTSNNILNTIGFETTAGQSVTASTAVPEPATWAMFIVGVGLVGGTLRRKNRVRTSVRFA
jgi:hypothetical protein